MIPLSNSRFQVYGDGKDWFSFWSGYSGALISGLITLLVLYKTLRQNQENHIKQIANAEKLNKEQISFQINLLTLQNKQTWLVDLKRCLAESLEVLDYKNIENLVNKISIISSNKELIDEVSIFEKEIKSITVSLSIFYHDDFSQADRARYKKSLDNMVKQLFKVLKAFSGYLISMEKAVVDCPTRMENVKNIGGLDLSELVLLTENGYKTFSEKRDNIKNILVDHKKSIDLINDTLQKETIELIKFEEREIDKGNPTANTHS